MARTSYNEKLHDSKNMPEVLEVQAEYAAKMGGTKMLIAAPLQYDAIMKQVPPGKLITTDSLRGYLAKAHGADFTCPLTAGIFINIAANAANEREDNPTPWWRTVKKDGELCEKFPGGLEGHRALLEAEGHKIRARGKRMFVENFAEKLHGIC